jgi:hypothetical protein
VPTSCLTIAIASVGSMIAQYSMLKDHLQTDKVLLLVGGVLFSGIITQKLLSKVSAEKSAPARTWIYACLLLFSAIALIFK